MYADDACQENANASELCAHEREDGSAECPLASGQRVYGNDARHEHAHEYASSVHEYAGDRGVRLNATKHPMPSIARPVTMGL